MFYDRYVALCRRKQISPSAAAQRMGISKAAVTSWKKNPGAIPSGDVLQKVSAFFDVSADYLLGSIGLPDAALSCADRLEGVYFNFAKDAQDNGIDPEDIRLAIETIKRLRGN